MQMIEPAVSWVILLLLRIYLLLGRKILQFFLYPIVSIYWLINFKGRQASCQFLQKISSYDSAHSAHLKPYNSYRHFINFANSWIDKLTAWSGSLTLHNLEFYGHKALLGHINQNQGVLILGSHLGNIEGCRAIAKLKNTVIINVLVHSKHTDKLNLFMNHYSAAGLLNFIQIAEINTATAMILQDKIEAGEWVVIAADRIYSKKLNRLAKAEFLGNLAYFAQEPFLLALLLKCPVYTSFCLKQNNKQAIYFDPLSNGLSFSKKQRTAAIQQCVENYAERLQHYCLKEPLQWFNFYDFWHDLE